ncbi:hypothetical protein P154DRAFT_538193 [Amniculicola lignicola CBS 123094]|uniref:Uncharacterized protein n=1 Tax=Amniculicola lignicola CBS 123094 TaxID=1392246 RepID=A0A6A5WAP4_9PLEO|nr:hypothetical protein P154DRAFT_538193 [Amniculicola lignicola CBS 123094]
MLTRELSSFSTNTSSEDMHLGDLSNQVTPELQQPERQAQQQSAMQSPQEPAEPIQQQPAIEDLLQAPIRPLPQPAGDSDPKPSCCFGVFGYSHDTSSASGRQSSTSRANETGTVETRGSPLSDQIISNNPPGPQASILSRQSNRPSPEPPVQLDTCKPKASGQGGDPRQRAASSTRRGPSRYRQPSCSGRLVPTSHPQTGNDAQTPDVTVLIRLDSQDGPDVLPKHKTASRNVASGPKPALVVRNNTPGELQHPVPQIPIVWRDPNLHPLSHAIVQPKGPTEPEANDADHTPLPATYHQNHPQGTLQVLPRRRHSRHGLFSDQRDSREETLTTHGSTKTLRARSRVSGLRLLCRSRAL